MKSRRNSSPDVSFFSFQDIITSVTGIMLLVVLMLVLDLLTRKKPNTQDQPTIPETSQVKNDIAKMESEITSMETWLSSTVRPESAYQVRERIELLKLESDTLRKKAEAATSRNISLKKKMKDNQATLKLLKDKSLTQEALKGKVTGLERDLAEKKAKLEEAKKQLEQKKNTVEFTVDRTERKSVVFVELDSAEIKTKRHKSKGFKTFSSDGPFLNSMLKNFKAWGKSNLSSSRDYVFLMLKPGATRYLVDIQTFLKERKIQYGIEPLEKGKTGITK